MIPLEDDTKDLYEQAPCGYISTQMDGMIVRANQTFLDWTGYTENEIVGVRRFSDLLTAGGRIYHETHYAPLLQMQGEAREIAIDILGADGRRLPALINSIVKKDEEGNPAVIRTAIFHATDRREYERELLRARERAEETEAQVRLLAETLQASLIPPAPPHIPGVDLGAVYRAAASGMDVGGDFYDVFEIARDDWVVVIGDVCGKGAKAAAITALARYTIRAAAIQVRGPSRVLHLLNEAMLRQQPDSFCTVLYARVRRGRHGIKITIAVGGHPLPLLVKPDGRASTIGVPGTVIGVVPDPDLKEYKFELQPGDVLTFFTDGVTEGRSGDEFFGEDRLADLVVTHRTEEARALATRIGDELLRFQDGRPRDDIAALVLKTEEVN